MAVSRWCRRMIKFDNGRGHEGRGLRLRSEGNSGLLRNAQDPPGLETP